MEPDEDFDHRARQPLIQGETLAGPVAGGTQAAQLMQNAAAVRFTPLPDAALKGLAAELMAVGALAAQLALNDVLGGDSGMVGARHPQRVVALHPAHPHDHVLQGDVQCVSQMQLAGDVGRRDDDRKHRPRPRRVGGEVAQLHPALIPALGDFRIECLAQFQLESVRQWQIDRAPQSRPAMCDHINSQPRDSTCAGFAWSRRAQTIARNVADQTEVEKASRTDASQCPQAARTRALQPGASQPARSRAEKNRMAPWGWCERGDLNPHEVALTRS